MQLTVPAASGAFEVCWEDSRANDVATGKASCSFFRQPAPFQRIKAAAAHRKIRPASLDAKIQAASLFESPVFIL